MTNARPIAIAVLYYAAAAYGQTSASPELVLSNGARLEARTSSSNIAVIAGVGIKRRYEWDHCGLDADMSARKERWLGSMGIYDPAGRLFVNPFAGCRGISRTVVQEGQIHFADEGDANAWISHYRRSFDSVVWTHDGLLVAWDVRPERNQLGVDVYQICIRGQRPLQLTGALDDAVRVSHPSGPNAARLPCVQVADSVLVETKKAWSDLWRQ
jgi:hypothetical protein